MPAYSTQILFKPKFPTKKSIFMLFIYFRCKHSITHNSYFVYMLLGNNYSVFCQNFTKNNGEYSLNGQPFPVSKTFPE
jgi:hypothetical protein